MYLTFAAMTSNPLRTLAGIVASSGDPKLSSLWNRPTSSGCNGKGLYCCISTRYRSNGKKSIFLYGVDVPFFLFRLFRLCFNYADAGKFTHKKFILSLSHTRGLICLIFFPWSNKSRTKASAFQPLKGFPGKIEAAFSWQPGS